MILSYINSFINITCGLPCRQPVYIIIIINFESNIKSNRFNNTNQVQSIVVRSISFTFVEAPSVGSEGKP